MLSDHEINGVEHKISELLPFVDDDYEGVIVEMKINMDPKSFVEALRYSFTHWRLQGKKGVWLNLPLSHVNLVEPAVKEGFRYHHAEPTYLMLVYWIPKVQSTIPLNASHRVRVGAVVLNNNKEILVVQEKYGTLRGSGIWKIPTGVVDEGEDIFAAAIREVKEETGIDTEFLEIVAFCLMFTVKPTSHFLPSQIYSSFVSYDRPPSIFKSKIQRSKQLNGCGSRTRPLNLSHTKMSSSKKSTAFAQ